MTTPPAVSERFAFTTPFTPRPIAGDLEKARSNLQAWAADTGLLSQLPEMTPNKLDSWNLHSYAGASWPDATGPALDLAARYLAWYCLFDNYLDGPAGTDAAYVSEICWELIDIARAPDFVRATIDSPFVDTYRSMFDAAARGKSARWRRRYAYSWESYLDAYPTESLIRTGKIQVSSPDAYVALRRTSNGMLSTFDITEAIYGFELSDRAARHPTTTALREAANKIMWGINDLASVPKDTLVNEPNIVLLLERDPATSREGALRYFVDELNLCVELLRQLATELRSEITSWPTAERATTERFILSIEDLTQANLAWHLRSARYDTPKGSASSANTLI